MSKLPSRSHTPEEHKLEAASFFCLSYSTWLIQNQILPKKVLYNRPLTLNTCALTRWSVTDHCTRLLWAGLCQPCLLKLFFLAQAHVTRMWDLYLLHSPDDLLQSLCTIFFSGYRSDSSSSAQPFLKVSFTHLPRNVTNTPLRSVGTWLRLPNWQSEYLQVRCSTETGFHSWPNLYEIHI